MLPQASMKQALYVIIALMQISFFAFNFQRWKMNRELKVVQTELQMIATGVAADILDEIGTMDFEDIDELDTSEGDPETTQVTLENDTFDFEVHTYVEYVDKQGSSFIPVGETETDFQEVTLIVSGIMSSEITASRIYSTSSN